jgi:hypothetical protein
MKTDCVQCGYCCTISACQYGKWDLSKQQCQFLLPDSKCAKYKEIVELEKNFHFPMMGCGCSSTLFNERREKKVKWLKNKFCQNHQITNIAVQQFSS